VVAVEGGTHSANLTHPTEVNRAILDFLAGLAG
jgi:pimeloyl-ACP methyl ester carboxylesterase